MESAVWETTGKFSLPMKSGVGVKQADPEVRWKEISWRKSILQIKTHVVFCVYIPYNAVSAGSNRSGAKMYLVIVSWNVIKPPFQSPNKSGGMKKRKAFLVLFTGCHCWGEKCVSKPSGIVCVCVCFIFGHDSDQSRQGHSRTFCMEVWECGKLSKNHLKILMPPFSCWNGQGCHGY